ncbi:beta-lactamase family protein [Parasphingopyxis algicola]|uniref:serine hydrolase domain-containing protein n=1 Tax=Parasphingopyxis algicola TaxID=2026624 RepID=UPI0015A12624|nr:serine hydrolase domain-containing protein [Parasphingopyxis algicola]QLC24041.1 beta-lactamase family protein [Parasphingopyxis algicola]
MKHFHSIAAVACLLAFSGSAAHALSGAGPSPGDAAVPSEISERAQQLVAQPGIAALGIAMIENGEVQWAAAYGQQAPGVPASTDTMFNTASVAKTIIAETVLRLVGRDGMSLDDPIAEFYRHPDLSADPRYEQLTPRLILSHQAGLLNWPYLYDDGKLAFVADPGQGEIRYSGAGIRILARYLEERFGASYPDIVQQTLLDPLGVTGISVRRTPDLAGRVPQARTPDGRTFPPFTRSEEGGEIEIGQWSAADNLFASVEGYADLLTRVIAGEGLSPEMAEERQRLHSSSETELGYQCILPAEECPSPLGFGLGWTLFGEPDRMILNHSGNDFGEHAQVYFSPQSGDGLVLFFSGGNAWVAGLELMELVDPDLRMARHYRALYERMQAQQSAEAE